VDPGTQRCQELFAISQVPFLLCFILRQALPLMVTKSHSAATDIVTTSTAMLTSQRNKPPFFFFNSGFHTGKAVPYHFSHSSSPRNRLLCPAI
jgi:hypothetical protein